MKLRRLFSAAFLGLLFLGMSQFAQAQQGRFVLKINPLSLFAVTANVQGEYALSDKLSAQLGVFVGSVNLGFGASNADGGVAYTWYGLTPELRYYATHSRKSAPAGFYLAPFLRYRGIQTSYDGSVYDPDTQTNTTAEVTAKINAFGGGALLGYQFLFGDVFALDLFFGPQYTRANSSFSVECTNCDGDETVVDEDAGISFGGVGVRTGICIGIAF